MIVMTALMVQRLLDIVHFSKLPTNFGNKCDPVAHQFFFFPTWWEYLGGKVDQLGQCSIYINFPNGLFAIGLAILDMMLRLAGFVAVVSIIIAGFQHQFTDGDAQKAATARKRIYNSMIGLAIALTATALVTFVGKQLG